MRGLLLICAALSAGNFALAAEVPEGIPRELARERAAQISDVRYHLKFTLTPHAATVAGHEELRFHANVDGAVLLDFREGSIETMAVNGSEAPTKMVNGHLELPANAVLAGENYVTLDFTAPVAAAGKAITRFEDKDDNTEYLYTLFVPMDAEMAFPCFDQPDLKARFRLELSAPEDWTPISNTNPISFSVPNHGQRLTLFAETRPISTYLFAFAAGPFRKVHETQGLPGLYVRQSKFAKAETEAPEVQQVTEQGIEYLSKYFAQPFPFPKYDMVLIPGFAYGGMEHAGATFLREESVLFRTAPTHSDHLGRDILLLHELTHQWFGDFTTMRWFDDLWLKEGFAQYMAYHALADLMPNENIWKRFYQSIKPAAYAIDSTKGTTPIYQDIPNLKDAKSAYGAIVYSKAPGVLKQLAFVLGEENFRDGLRLYLKEHQYGNAEWSDLVRALERISGKSLQDWAAMWIRRRGMPQVDVEWSCDSQKRIDRFVVKQQDVLEEGGIWPIAIQIMLAYANGAPIRMRTQLNTEKAEVPEAVGKACPAFVFLNDQDFGYGRFLLDDHSRRAVVAHLGQISDVFERTLLWGSLWDSVREAELAPRDFLESELRLMPRESDEALLQSLIGEMTTGLHRYAGEATRREIGRQAEEMAASGMLNSQNRDFRILWFRGLRAIAESEQGRAKLKDLLSGKLMVPGVELRPLDRWTIVTALIAMKDAEADAVLAAEQKRDSTGDGLKYAYVAQAARPDADNKQHYFDDYLHNAARPEDWIEQSLGAFNYWNQSALTLPYLKPALEALPQIKRERKIFFLMGWLNAFVGGQRTAEAQVPVRGFLQTSGVDPDLKLKILEALDELDRTVKIRQKYP
ncbi:MAG TPA: M1 family aminopeptidase [Candidatus Methylomirabilis sp.]|nr:M1 family aminopeptidase [Candidatus Methylomirabilis sp.]